MLLLPGNNAYDDPHGLPIYDGAPAVCLDSGHTSADGRDAACNVSQHTNCQGPDKPLRDDQEQDVSTDSRLSPRPVLESSFCGHNGTDGIRGAGRCGLPACMIGVRADNIESDSRVARLSAIDEQGEIPMFMSQFGTKGSEMPQMIQSNDSLEMKPFCFCGCCWSSSSIHIILSRLM